MDELDRVQEEQAFLTDLQMQSLRLRRETRGESRQYCEACGCGIPAARQQAISGVKTCIRCQQTTENHQRLYAKKSPISSLF